MPRRKNQTTTDNSEMTVVMFQIKGDDQTLQEGFKAMSQAMAQFAPQVLVQTSPVLVPSAQRLVEQPSELVAPTAEVEIQSSAPAPKSPRRTLRSPEVLDLDLTSGDLSLEDLLSEVPTTKTNERYLLIAYWLKESRSLDGVTMDHIHTGFRHMGWQTPRDAGQPLRDLKKNGWFHKGEGKGEYRINHVGENHVMKLRSGAK